MALPLPRFPFLKHFGLSGDCFLRFPPYFRASRVMGCRVCRRSARRTLHPSEGTNISSFVGKCKSDRKSGISGGRKKEFFSNFHFITRVNIFIANAHEHGPNECETAVAPRDIYLTLVFNREKRAFCRRGSGRRGVVAGGRLPRNAPAKEPPLPDPPRRRRTPGTANDRRPGIADGPVGKQADRFRPVRGGKRK